MQTLSSQKYMRAQLNAFFMSRGQTTGNIFYVSSTTLGMMDGASSNTDGRSGKDPRKPFATLAYAITKCTASQFDTIVCMPYHAEAVIAASTIAMSTIGVRVIGLGYGNARPTFSWTTILSATLTMSAANGAFENCIFDLSGITALVSGIVVSAAGCVIRNNTFLTSKAGTGTAPLQSILTTAAADRLLIDGNEFIAPATTPTTVAAATSCITIVGGTQIKVVNNTINCWCTTSTGPISCITTLTNAYIRNNTINNLTASSTKAITMLTGSLGSLIENKLGILSGSAPITADTMNCIGNTYAATNGVGTAPTALVF